MDARGFISPTPPPLVAEPDLGTAEAWRQDLLDIADRIESRGHAKSTLFDENTGAVCFLGALYNHRIEDGVEVCDQISFERHNAVVKRIERFVGGDVLRWNNAPERKAREVISACRECARS